MEIKLDEDPARSIFFLIVGLGLLYWKIQSKRKKKKNGEFNPIETSRSFGDWMFGILFTIGGIIGLIQFYL